MCAFLIYGDKMNEFMEIAIKEAEKAYKKNEVPVGAVIVKNNKVIAKSYNKREKKQNVIKHAEINAIEKACKKLKTWRLEECEIYTTLEPCLMCCGAIEQARIKRIYYAASSPSFGQVENNNKVFQNNTKIEIYKIDNEEKAVKLLQNFFKSKRK